ncbi:MAG TPA: cytoplasmic filament protein CfpA, partial [Spirochaetales bacterium]|nr:cytoplasmic filament protein CfpA [Spirochaetales bacterium]
DGMANVLNEFLHGVSKGFQDAAFASFSRRRSTVREDIAQSFAPPSLEEGQESASSGYLAMLNAEPAALPEATATRAPSTRGRKPAARGVVDSAKRPGRKPGPKAGGRSRRDSGGVREL